MAIAITEEFDDALGRYLNYDTDDIIENNALAGRSHINLRSFFADEYDISYFMYSLNILMTDIDMLDMSDLEGTFLVTGPEPWTFGNTGPDVSNNNRNTLRLSCVIGVNTTISATDDIALSGFKTGDTISMALPAYPGDKIDRANSYIEISKGADIVHLLLSGLPTTAGDAEALWPISDLGDLVEFDTIKIVFKATATCTVTVAALRILSESWTPTILDIDTRTQRLVQTVDRDGSDPVDLFPKLWRSSPDSIPLPVNLNISADFNTGALTGDNSISLFLRGRREDFITQLDLDGSGTLDTDGTPLYGENQQTLENLNHQPDYGRAEYNPRPQSDLDSLSQENLEMGNQAELERVQDLILASWISIQLQFGDTNQIIISTTETLTDSEKIFIDVDLEDQTEYLFSVDLDENNLRVQINEMTEEGLVGTVILDSGVIINSSLFPHRKGRIGYEIALDTGDAWVGSVRTRGLMFGEIITNNFESFTPVIGTRLYAGCTPDLETIPETGFYGAATLSPDLYNAQSKDGLVRVTASDLDGIQTSAISFDDFHNSEIVFDLYYPSSAIRSQHVLAAALINNRGFLIELSLPGIVGDKWQTIKIPTALAAKELTGSYRFVLLQATGLETWNIDNLYMRQRLVAWSARATLDDPWDRDDDNWTEFRDLVNSDTDGVVFAQRGSYLQARGQALTQDAVIEKVYLKPQYAELGRMTWND